jgi:hypothetical protein
MPVLHTGRCSTGGYPCQVLAHAGHRHAEAFSDFSVGQAVDAAMQEGCAGLARQFAEQAVDGLEVFEDQLLFFRRG